MFPFNSSIYWPLCPTQRGIEKYKSNMEWLSLFSMNYEEALGAMDVDGIPDTGDKRVTLESILCTDKIAFDTFMGPIITLPGMPAGIVTGYGYPEETNIYSANGKIFHTSVNFIPGEGPAEMDFRREVLGQPTCALVQASHLGVPFLAEVIKFTNWMYETLVTLDIARQNSKDVYFLFAEEEAAKGVEKLIEKRQTTRSPVKVISTGRFSAKDKALITPTDACIGHLQPLTALYEWYQSQYRQEYGRQGVANPDKTERLNIPETKASLSAGVFSIQKRVDYLNCQMDFYNPLLGTEIKFKVVEDNAFNVSAGAGEMAGPGGGNGDRDGSGDGGTDK